VVAASVICLIVIGILTQSRKHRGIAQSRPDSLYRDALSWESKGEFIKAGKLYQEAIKQFPDFKQISELEKRLWALNVKTLFSPNITEKDTIYKVEPKDTLGKIAAKYNTTVDLIKRSNDLKSNLIRPGNRLKISLVKYSVIVDKSQNILTLKADDEIFKVYSVATGKHSCTPTGAFQIVEKLNNPDWYKGGEGIIPADSPKNILGSRWLGLSEPQYGIHGGAKEEDLGQQLTNGCVRMTDSEVEELFTILPRGAEVTITE
jgi:lipoprotein-anchoring transpeptidase ErfK/SrfK